MQTSEVLQAIFRTVFFALTVSLVMAQARPPHFGETNQVLPEQESNNIQFENAMRPQQIEALAQRLAELNQINQLGGPIDYFDRALRSGNEIKRQSRYRLCYFNPVSCFKK